jgi:putative flippase GtrA
MNARFSRNFSRDVAIRWLKFNAVGGLGIGLQLALLFVLKSGLHLNYLTATALAVEATVLHNFLWHERYTWAGRIRRSWRHSFTRLLRFNLTNGLISLAGNLGLMKLLVGMGRRNYLAVNLAAIALCSLVNFLLSEGWVFAKSPVPAPIPPKTIQNGGQATFQPTRSTTFP